MTDRAVRYPLLYSIPGNPGEIPFLRGCHCRQCGYIIFPPQDFGCDKCGAGSESLESKSLQGIGILSRFATVYNRGKPSFVVASVKLADGPLVEAQMDCRDDSSLQIGLPVEAVLVEDGQNQEGQIVLDYRFRVTGG